MNWIIILLALGFLAYDIWKGCKRFAQRKEPWLKIRNSAVNSRNAPDKNAAVLKRTKLYQGIILEFSFPECRYSNLDIINITLSEYALKDVTVKEHTGALVATENRGIGADRGLQYALKTCTLQCDLMPSGSGLDLRINTMTADKSVKDCALAWQQRNPGRKLCKKIFRELENAYALVVVHHDKSKHLPQREIIPRDQVASRRTPVSSPAKPQPAGTTRVPSGRASVASPTRPKQSAGSDGVTVRQEGDTLYIDGHGEVEGSLTCKIPPFRNVVLGPGISRIGNRAFLGRTDLTSITIADSVVEIGREAFSGCTGLVSLTIPDSVMEIGKEAFSGCTGLTSLIVPANCRRIGANAFQDVPHIRYDGAVWEKDNWGAKAVARPQCIKYFCGRPGKDTLVWHMVDDTLYIEGQGRLCRSEKNWLPYKIRHVVIAPGCTAIADHVFCGHRNLESIHLPDTLRTIGSWAFAHCTGLKEIKIPDSVVGIGTGAFAECIGLKRIHLPEKLSQIHDDTFKHCRKLKNVQIPDSVHYIGKHAFYRVGSVANLPGNLGNWGTKTPAYAKRGYGLGEGAFAEAGLPAHLEIPDRIRTIPEQAFYECKTLVSVKLPNYMTEIGGYAFAGCKGLECLEIPKTVTKIGTNAFWRVRHIIYHGLAQSDDNWGAQSRN